MNDDDDVLLGTTALLFLGFLGIDSIYGDGQWSAMNKGRRELIVEVVTSIVVIVV